MKTIFDSEEFLRIFQETRERDKAMMDRIVDHWAPQLKDDPDGP